MTMMETSAGTVVYQQGAELWRPSNEQIICFLSFSPQVRISVVSTNCHADALNLEVISNKPHLAPVPQQSCSHHRSQVVQEVVRLAEEAQEKAAQKPKLSKEEREFRQSRTPNVYSLLEEVRELALMDLDTLSHICAATA